MEFNKDFEDSQLGLLKWREEADEWEFLVNFIPDKEIKFYYAPDTDKSRLEAEDMEKLKSIIEYVRQHEIETRKKVGKKMFSFWMSDWADDEDTVDNLEDFCETISLSGGRIYDDFSGELYYNDGDLFGGHTLQIYLDSEGVWDGEEPTLWG